MTAGMAANRPAAVVISASAMPGATARRLAAPAEPRPEKASMMPQTVPKRPIKGLTEPVVASHCMPFSTRRTSSEEACCMVAVTAERLFNLGDRKSTRLNSSHVEISYAVFCLKKKKKNKDRESNK